VENNLASLNTTLTIPTQLGNDEDFEVVARSSSILPRLQLFSKGRAVNRGTVPVGTYGLVMGKDSVIPLGASVDVIPLARRPEAVDFSNGEVVFSYNVRSALFERIRELADQPGANAQYGTAFLFFERQSGNFCKYFFGSRSTRDLANQVRGFMALTEEQIASQPALAGVKPHGPLPMTMKVALRENKKGSWHVPDIYPCSVPFTNLPPVAVIAKEIEKFLSVKDTVEIAEEAPVARRAR
jgi:hypothetical protein